MPPRTYDALFLCTGNSARSIMAEAILGRLGEGRFRAHSAGSHPTGRVHPLALEVLEQRGHPTDGLRSKGWEELAAPGAPALDFVFTVCDDAANETCPTWPGKPISAHWGIADPAAFVGTEEARRRDFLRAYDELHRRIAVFAGLPIDALDRMELRARLEAIGKVEAPPVDGSP